jgi:hypothetical protein
LDEQLQAARSAADDKVKAAYKKEKEAAESEFAGHRMAMAEKIRIAKDASEVLSEMLQRNMDDFGARLDREIATEEEKAQIDKSKNATKQKDLEERLAKAQADLAKMQSAIDEKTRIHEYSLQEKTNTEQKELEKAKRELRSQQSGSVSELSEAQKKSQEALRRMQDECFGTIDNVRQQASGQCERRIRDHTAKFRNDLWQAQKNYNVWQKRLEKVLAEFDQVGCSDALCDRPHPHPCDFLYNRMLLRMFRALLEEKNSVRNEEDMSRLFEALPKSSDAGRVETAELSKETFREAVHQSLCFHRKFDLGNFVRSLEDTYTGIISVDDFESRLQANFAMDKATAAQIYKFVDAAANVAAKDGGPKPQPGIVQEEDLTALLDHAQVRKTFEPEAGIVDDKISEDIPVYRRLSARPQNSLVPSESSTPPGGGTPQNHSRRAYSPTRAFQRLDRSGGRRRSAEQLRTPPRDKKTSTPPTSASAPLFTREDPEKVDKVPAVDAVPARQVSEKSEKSAHYDGEARWV